MGRIERYVYGTIKARKAVSANVVNWPPSSSYLYPDMILQHAVVDGALRALDEKGPV